MMKLWLELLFRVPMLYRLNAWYWRTVDPREKRFEAIKEEVPF